MAFTCFRTAPGDVCHPISAVECLAKMNTLDIDLRNTLGVTGSVDNVQFLRS